MITQALSAFQLPSQQSLNRFFDGARYSDNRFNIVLIEKHLSPETHAAGNNAIDAPFAI